MVIEWLFLEQHTSLEVLALLGQGVLKPESRGFFSCQHENNSTEYVKCSVSLAMS